MSIQALLIVFLVGAIEGGALAAVLVRGWYRARLESLKRKEFLERNSVVISKECDGVEGDLAVEPVTAAEVKEAIEKNFGIEIPESAIEFSEVADTLGVYDVKVNLTYSSQANMKMWVIKEEVSNECEAN